LAKFAAMRQGLVAREQAGGGVLDAPIRGRGSKLLDLAARGEKDDEHQD